MDKKQELIATSPDVNVWVSANAGAGKTRILTHRVLRLLAEGAPPSSILCLTYTNAGAAEMRARIIKEVGRWATIKSDACAVSLETLLGRAPDSDTIARAQSLFAQIVDRDDALRIETIHAFCQSLLRRFPLEAHIFPHFTLMDNQEVQLLAGHCLMRLLSRTQESATLKESLSFLATSRADGSLRKMALSMVAQQIKWRRFFARTDVEDYIRDYAKRLQVDLGADLKATYFSYTPAELSVLRACVQKMLASGGKLDKQRGAVLARWFETQTQADAYVDAWLTEKETLVANMVSKAAGLSEAEAQAMDAERLRVEAYLKARSSLALLTETKHVLTFAEGLLALYEHEKQARGWMDFDDMIAGAESLLGASAMRDWVLYKLDSAIHHVLIDEAQDTSPSQWRIVEALTEEFFAGAGLEHPRSLFVVGDFKQSIFSFQGADADLFLAMKTQIKERAEAAGVMFYELALEESYRSTAPVLQAVDTIFQPMMPDIRHVLTRKNQAGKVVLWPLVTVEKAEKQEGWALPQTEVRATAEEKLVAALVAEIAGWIGVRDLPAKGRKVQPGDVMILLKKRGTLAMRLVNAFKARGIPVSGADRMVLADHLAVQDMLALLKFALLPQDDYTLACVLKSPLCGLTEDALFELAHRRIGTLFEALKTSSHTQAIELLSSVLALADKRPPSALMAEVLGYGMRRNFAARLGADALSVLDTLLQTAHEYEALHPPSVQGFVHFMEQVETEFTRGNASENVVRVMTVHGAKGLQAPIVILPDAASPLSAPEQLTWQKGEPRLLPPDKGSYGIADDVKDARRNSMQSEYLRLFYVALTRAEDELYILGYTGRSVPETSWYTLAQKALTPISEPLETPVGRGVAVICHPERSEGSLCPQKVLRYAQDDREIPKWATTPVALEPMYTAPVLPSKQDAESENTAPSPLARDVAVARGRMVHHLLQYLPEIEQGRRAAVAKLFLARRYADAEEDVREQVVRDVVRLMDHPEFGCVWNGKREVPVAGRIDGKLVAGQVDALAFRGNELWVVDYKTSAVPPASTGGVPEAYRKQMALYGAVLTQAYPNHRVRTFLLWTTSLTLMELDESMVET